MTPELRRRREAIVREHMESENDFDTTIGTFGHPRYELVRPHVALPRPRF